MKGATLKVLSEREHTVVKNISTKNNPGSVVNPSEFY
jgi:hypothetical protein